MRRFALSTLVLGLVLIPSLATAAGSSAQVTGIPISADPGGWLIHDVEGKVTCPSGQTYTGVVVIKDNGATIYSAAVRGRCTGSPRPWRVTSESSVPACPGQAVSGGRIELSGGTRFAVTRGGWVFPACG